MRETAGAVPVHPILLLLALAMAACNPAPVDVEISADELRDDVPFLAVWRQHDGYTTGGEAPYLRYAFWSTGRVVFAPDKDTWGHDLREGYIDKEQVAGLKTQLRETGVFDLEGTCYLMPDAPTDCVLVRFGGDEQMLYWDEVRHLRYGINVHPQERHLRFMSTWGAVNDIAFLSLPASSVPSTDRFADVPKTWYIARAIQSR